MILYDVITESPIKSAYRSRPLLGLRQPTVKWLRAGAYSSPAPSCGSSVASIFESRVMLVAWISARRCFCSSVSTSRYRSVPSRVTSCPFWRVRASLRCQAWTGAVRCGSRTRLVIAPALLGVNREDDVLEIVLGGVGPGVLPGATDRNDFVEHRVLGSVPSGFCRCVPYTLAQRVCRAIPSQADWSGSAVGGPDLLWSWSPHRNGPRGSREGERPSHCGDVLGTAR